MDSPTGLVLLTPEVDPVVDRWRRRYDPVASFGMPAHVTVLYPWMRFAEITAEDRAALADLCCALPVIEMTFERFGRFDQTLWLDPQPAAPIIELVERVVRRWPKFPPFGGAFPDIVAHLTLADRQNPTTMTDVVGDVGPRLPLRSTATVLSLMRLESRRWFVDSQFPFAAASCTPEQSDQLARNRAADLLRAS